MKLKSFLQLCAVLCAASCYDLPAADAVQPAGFTDTGTQETTTAMPDPFDSATRPDIVYTIPARADVQLAEGRILAADHAGYGVAAEDSDNLIVLGRIRTPLDTRNQLDGEAFATYDVGVFTYRNSGSAPVTQAHYGRPVYIEDDVTVTSAPGSNCFAGFCRGFDGGNVWVDMRPLPMLAAFFAVHPDGNFRISSGPTGSPVLQLWNQDQGLYQTCQLAGSAGTERLIIG